MKYNVYNINNCDFLGSIKFKSCKSTIDVGYLEFNFIIDDFEPLFKSYNKELYDNRYTEHSWFMFVNSKTLEPALEIEYNEFDGETSILVDTPEHDTRAIFFNNLYRKYVDIIKLEEIEDDDCE